MCLVKIIQVQCTQSTEAHYKEKQLETLLRNFDFRIHNSELLSHNSKTSISLDSFLVIMSNTDTECAMGTLKLWCLTSFKAKLGSPTMK